MSRSPLQITVNSSTLPWTNQDGNSFRFQLGNLSSQECGSVEPDPVLPGTNQVQVYPNPFAESAQFVLDQNIKLPVEFKLLDTNGRQLRTETHQSRKFDFKRKGLVSGLYFYQVLSAGNTLFTGKVIIRELLRESGDHLSRSPDCLFFRVSSSYTFDYNKPHARPCI